MSQQALWRAIIGLSTRYTHRKWALGDHEKTTRLGCSESRFEGADLTEQFVIIFAFLGD